MLKGLGGLGGLGDITKMLKAAQEMQTRMATLTEEMDRITVTGTSGAGLVTAVCTARGELKSLDIDASIFQPSEKAVVEDLILAAIKDAQKHAQERLRDEQARMMQSMGLPADMKLPF